MRNATRQSLGPTLWQKLHPRGNWPQRLARPGGGGGPELDSRRRLGEDPPGPETRRMATSRLCNETKNLKGCNCSYEPCSRKGNCCECLRYHRAQGELPACFFPNDLERGYDRSYGCFARAVRERRPWW